MTVTLPLPPRALHPNARPCWQARLRAAKKCRDEAAFLARRENNGRQWTRPELRATFYFRAVRKRDDDGLTAWLKSLRDGVADGVGLPDDHAMRTVIVGSFVDKADPRVVIELVETA